jgi:hypothetical protein
MKGANGHRPLRTPAMIIVPTLTSRPENNCHVTGQVIARGLTTCTSA